MLNTNNTQEIHKQITKRNLADGTGGTISSTISYVAQIRSAQSHNDNPIARAT